MRGCREIYRSYFRRFDIFSVQTRAEHELTWHSQDLALAHKDAIMAINDVRQMKTIALITMVLLPATAVAVSKSATLKNSSSLNCAKQGFMHAPVYNWEGKGYMFWVISVPITTVTILLYLAWTRFCNRARQC